MIALVQRGDAASYVLGAIGGEEALAFERLMAADTSLALEVDALREVAALLAYAAPMAPVPGGLRRRVVNAVTG